jgi:hypothetical protein
MRQIFTSQRLENVEGVAKMLNEAGIETYVSDARSYKGNRRGTFSYQQSGRGQSQPGVWIVKAEDVTRARQLLVDAGLIVIPLGKGHAFPKDLESTAHRLEPSHQFVLGFTATGICVWGQEGGGSRSMRLPDLTAGDISHDGQYLGLGARNGAVALARMDRIEKRVKPDLVRAFNGPVTSVAFSERGKWLATGAEALRIWSWED